MNKIYVNKLSRQLCLAILLVFSVSALCQRPFSSIHTGVNAADAKIIGQGVKTFATDKKGSQMVLTTAIKTMVIVGSVTNTIATLTQALILRANP